MDKKDVYQERLKRINDSIELREPDRVPIIPVVQCYPFLHSGYTMADILYDTDLSKSRKSIFSYLDEYQPDALFGHAWVNIAQGPVMEKTEPKTLRWAGMPGNIIDKNSIHQFIEFPVLKDNEFEEFTTDRTAWYMKKGLPRTVKLLENFKTLDFSSFGVFNSYGMIASAVSTPEFKNMIHTLWEINDMMSDSEKRLHQLDTDVEERGYPVLATGFASVPYDAYSDFLRGTLDGLADLYEHSDEIGDFCKEQLDITLNMIKNMGKIMPGKHVFMPLHKGMDTFMSDEQYRRFYWKDLQTIICAIIDAGMVPYIYTEGKYNTRLECLKEVPKGKVIYHFEDVDMIQAKKILGDTACIAGGFPVYLLDYGTKEEVADEVKRLIDGCSEGGGFIFETSCGMDYAKPENVEAMIKTVKEYGKK